MKRLIVDLDDTIASTVGGDYANATPNTALVAKLRDYQQSGFEIVIHTSRNMRTYDGSIGRINANTLPLIIDWLRKHRIPFDEVITAKPWCGYEGFYVDDRAIRPNEFTNLSYDRLLELIEEGKR